MRQIFDAQLAVVWKHSLATAYRYGNSTSLVLCTLAGDPFAIEQHLPCAPLRYHEFKIGPKEYALFPHELPNPESTNAFESYLGRHHVSVDAFVTGTYDGECYSISDFETAAKESIQHLRNNLARKQRYTTVSLAELLSLPRKLTVRPAL